MPLGQADQLTCNHRWARGGGIPPPPTPGGPAKIRQGAPGGKGIGGPRRRKIGRIGGPRRRKIGRIGGPTLGSGPG